VVSGISKVDEDGLGVSDVEVTVGLWRETRPDLTTSRLEVRFPKVGVNLRVSSWFMECAEEAFVKHRALDDGMRYCLPDSTYKRTFVALGFAESLSPNVAWKTRSTACFTSRGFAHRSSGLFLRALIVAPSAAHPETLLASR